MSKLLLIVSVVCTLAVATAQDDSWFEECLQAHNNYRTKEGKPKLQQSSELMSHAQQRVQQLVSDCKFDHDGNKGSGFGENLYAGSGYLGKTCKQAVWKWYNEKRMYNKNNPVFSPQTGHYTQVVWKSTIELGCAKGKYTGKCMMSGMTVVVCNYNPPGNFRGKFSENV